MEANEKINDSENKTISNFLNDVFSAALKDVAHKKEDLNIKNEKNEQKINLENNQIDINNINETNSHHNNEIENKTSSNNINDKNDFNKNLKIQSEVNLKINSNYLNYEEKEYLKNLNLGKIINLIKYKNKFLLFRKIERAITNNDEEFNKEIQPHFKSTMKVFKEKEEEEEKDFIEKEQMNPIINPVEIIKTQNSNNEEEEISFKEQKNNQNLEENNSNLNNNIDDNNNNFSSNSQLLNENQNNENDTVKRIVNDDEVYNKEFIPLIKNCYKQYKKEEEEVENENKIEVNPIINPVNILNTNNSIRENESKRSSLKNEESKEEYVKNLNENNFNSTASFNKSTLYTTNNLNQQNLNKVNNNNNKNNKKENIFNKSIENKNFKRIKLNYNFPYNKIYNMFKDHSYKLPVKYSEKKQKIKEENNNNVENLSFKNSVNTNNSFYNVNMKESNLNRSNIRNNSMQIIKKFPYNEEIENKKLLLNQHKIQKNYSSHNIFKNKKESFCKNDCCQFLRKYPWICPKCNKEHKCSHYKCQNCRRSFCFCKK